MSKETDLSSQWLEAWRLRQEGKEILLKNGVRLTDELEAQIFEKSDERLDDYFREIRRGENYVRKGNPPEGNKNNQTNNGK